MEDGIGESGCVREEYKFSTSLFVFIRIQIREQVTSSLVFIFGGLKLFFFFFTNNEHLWRLYSNFVSIIKL